jgi:hypothetical protein
VGAHRSVISHAGGAAAATATEGPRVGSNVVPKVGSKVAATARSVPTTPSVAASRQRSRACFTCKRAKANGK